MALETPAMSQNEKLLYREFRKRINSEAAHAQIKKLEYDLADVKAGLNFLKTACGDANSLGLGGVCVLPCFVRQCSVMLGNERKTSLVACIGAPYGGDVTDIKVKAVKRAVKDGADEAEVTAPTAHVREGNFAYVKREFKKLRSAAKHVSLRIDLECTLLTREEIMRTCSLAADCGVNSLSLSGGNCGEWLTDVKSAVKDRCTIKAEGVATVLEMSSSIDMGATVIGSKNAADVARAILTAADAEDL
ncbi:MAG: hypothetical protein K2K80_02970 [Clostridia bacterium]|nr:hypothetical protein [Clostridia bacterium]